MTQSGSGAFRGYGQNALCLQCDPPRHTLHARAVLRSERSSYLRWGSWLDYKRSACSSCDVLVGVNPAESITGITCGATMDLLLPPLIREHFNARLGRGQGHW